MRRRLHPAIGLLVGVITIAAIGVSVLRVNAQGAIGQEELEIRAGSVFEILADSDIPNAQYGWVLAQDRTFVQAGRDALFRTRFVQPGDYALSTEVTDAERTQQVRRIIRIRVVEVDPAAPIQTSTGTVFTVTPTADAQGQVVLEGDRQIIAITPTRERVSGLAIDLDPEKDGNGDGDTGNDPDTASSFFSSDGTPLHIWLSSFNGEQGMTIHGSDRSGALVRSQLRIVSPEKAAPIGGEGPVQITGGIMNSVLADGRVAFSVDPSIVDLSSTPVLLHWDFGDGGQSLLEKPLHAYTAAGLYTVTVTVRNLTDGTIIRELAAQLTVEDTAVVPTPTPDDGGTGGDVPTPTPQPSGGGSMLGLILKVGGALILAILLGLLGMFAFSRLRRVSTAGLDRPMGSDAPFDPKAAAIIDVAAPMALPETPEETEPKVPEVAAPAPASDDGSMPSWLQPSNEPAAQEPPSMATVEAQNGDMPSWLSATPTVSEPTPPPPPLPSEPATATETSELPDWLQPQAPAPAPASVIDVPVPEPEPTPAPAAAPATGDGELPAWLQPQASAPTVEPQSVVTQSAAIPETTPVAETPAPQTTGDMPAWLQPQVPPPEVAIPEPVAAPLPTPEPTPTPEPVVVPEQVPTRAADPEPTPVVIANPTPAPVAEPEPEPASEPEPAAEPTAAAGPEKDAETLAREERERERRRQKRKRYQENLKKRKNLEAAKEPKADAAPDAAVPAPEPSPEPTSIARAPAVPVVETATAPTPEPTPVQEPVVIAAPEPTPAPVAPAAPESVVPAEPVKDDSSVAFIVRADSIDQTTGEAPKPDA